jgi:hypothetical protein
VTAALAGGRIVAEHRMSGRHRALAWGAVLLGFAVLVLVVRWPSEEGVPLDPGGTGRLGAKALVLLLREGGADVRVSARPPSADRRTAVVLRDTFDRGRTEAIERWVAEGGTLVVADPGSSLTLTRPYLSPINGVSPVDEVTGRCAAIPALAGIGRVRTGGSLVYDRAHREPGAISCFGRDDGDWLVATPAGRGTVVAVGGAGPFVNDNLDEEDAAGLAMALLAPLPGTPTQVISDLAPDAGELGIEADTGDGGGAFDGLPAAAWVAGVQLLIAFLGAALWRGRRLGRPVVEDPPVEIPGSELVVAVGDLYQKGRHRRRAAEALADQARRVVADRLGLPRRSDTQTIAQVAASRTGIPVDQVHAAVAPPDPPDDEALVALARSTDQLVARLAAPPTPNEEQT